MVDIVIDNVTKKFGDFTAVDDLEIVFEHGQVSCLLGPSGCGKTTLMRMVAGLETLTSGRVLFGEKDVSGWPARKREVGMVFQYPVMYPTLSVQENISVPLKHDRSLSGAEIDKRVGEVLEILDLSNRAKAFIEDLNAGDRQKVAVGRAVIRRSEVILFDEPTTNVEVKAKLQLIRAFKEVSRRFKQTTVYVTHDQTEAMTLADRIALMQDGRIVQYDSPRGIYGDPSTEFGGWFLGNPGMNFVPAEIRDGRLHAAILREPLTVPGGLENKTLRLGIRPESIRVSGEPGPDFISGTLIDRAIGIAGYQLIRAAVGDQEVKLKSKKHLLTERGGAIGLEFPRDHLLLFADGERVDLFGGKTDHGQTQAATANS